MIKAGNYIYYIQKWIKAGVEKSSELKYFIGNVDDGSFLSPDDSEKIMNSIISAGESLVDATIRLDDFEPFYNCAQNVINYAWDNFENFTNNYKRKSKAVYNKQVAFVNFTADRKIKTIEETIEKLKTEYRGQKVIHMNEKHIEKIKRERDVKLKELKKEQFIEPELSDLAIGVLIVE